MNEQESKTEGHINEYAENYMEKVFYFCLKKTGNSAEAEDMTSEISLCVFTQLRRGATPEAFSAWVWRIACNRYSKWADAKHRKNDAVTGADMAYKKLFDEAVKIGYGHYMFCRGIICAEVPGFFKNDRYQIDHACANIYEMRGAVLEEALKTGYISYSENDERKMLGAYLYI